MSVAQDPLPGLADRLWTAEIDRTPVSPLSDERPGLQPEEAYAVQNRNIERRLAAGRVLRGRKLGLTSLAMQELLGITGPISGVLLDDMIIEESDQIGNNRPLRNIPVSRLPISGSPLSVCGR
jgi:2-keto-4-pentenoate hydratase